MRSAMVRMPTSWERPRGVPSEPTIQTIGYEDDDDQPGEALESVATVALRVVEALEEHHEYDDQEDQAGNPPHVLVGGDSQGADETADDVQHHVSAERDDGGGVSLGQESEVHQDERASDDPVEVASPEDDTGGGVSGLVLHTEASPRVIFWARYLDWVV